MNLNQNHVNDINDVLVNKENNRIIVVAPFNEKMDEIIEFLTKSFDQIFLILSHNLKNSKVPFSRKNDKVKFINQDNAISIINDSKPFDNNQVLVVIPEIYDVTLSSGIEILRKDEKYVFSVFPILLYLKAKVDLLIPIFINNNIEWNHFPNTFLGEEFTDKVFSKTIDNLLLLESDGYCNKLQARSIKNIAKKQIMQLARLEAIINLKKNLNSDLNFTQSLQEIRALKVKAAKQGNL